MHHLDLVEVDILVCSGCQVLSTHTCSTASLLQTPLSFLTILPLTRLVPRLRLITKCTKHELRVFHALSGRSEYERAGKAWERG